MKTTMNPDTLITFRAPQYMEQALKELRGKLYAQHMAEKAMAEMADMPQDELDPMADSQKGEVPA